MKKSLIINIPIFILIIILVLCIFNKEETIYTYLLSKQDETMSEKIIDCIQILTFDNNNICIDCRCLYEFKDENEAKEQYNNWLDISNQEKSSLKNVYIKNNVVTFNSTSHNGEHKSKFLDTSNHNKYIEI